MRIFKYLLATFILFLLGRVIYSSQAPFTIKDQPYINSNFNDIYEKMDTHRHNDPDSAAPQNFIPELDSTYSLGNSLKQWATTYTDAIVFPDGSIQVTAPSGIPGGEVLLTFVDNGSKLAISSLNVLSTQFVRTSAGSSATYTLNQASVTLMGPFAKIRLDNLDSSTAAITSSLNGFSVFKSTAESYIQGFLVFRSTAESKIDALGVSTQSIATTLAGFVVFKSTAETKIDALSVFKSTAESSIDALGVSTQTLLSMFSSFSVFRSTAEQKIDGLTTFRSTAEVNIDALSASTTSLNVSISAFSVFKSTAETKIDALGISTQSLNTSINGFSVFKSTAEQKIDSLSISTSNLAIQINSTYTWAAGQFNAVAAATSTLTLQPSNTNYIQNQSQQINQSSFSVLSGSATTFYPQRIVWPDGSVQVTSPTAGGGGSGDATVAQINSTYTWAVGQFNAVSLATATLTLHPSNTNYIRNQIASVQQASYSVLLGSISGNLYVGATGFFNAITLDGTYGFGVPDLRINQRGTGIHFDNWYGGASYEPHFDMRIFSAFSQGIKFSSGSMGWQIQDQNSAVKHHWSDQGKVVVNDSNPAAAAVRISSDNVGSLSRHISLANQNNGTGNWANSGSGIFFNNTSADTGENAAIVSRLVRVSPSRATDIMFLSAPGNGPLTYDAAVMTIKSTGTVGIGTVDPKAALHVTSGTVLATNTGNVGIGTINPSQKLDVVGFVKTSGGIIFPDNSAQLTAASTSPWAYSGADIYNVNSGNIGVGNSNTNPQSLFEIEGTFLSTANPSFHAIGRYSQFSSYRSTSSVSISTMIPNLYAITDFGQNYSIGYGMLVTSGPVYATELCHFTDGTIFTGGTRNVSLFAGNGDFKGTVLLTTNSQTANNWRCAPLPAPVQLNEKTTYYPMSLVGGTTNYVGGVSLRQTNDHFQFTSAVSVLASSPIFTLSNDRGNDNYFGGAFKFVTSTPTITIRDGNVGIGTTSPNKKLHLNVGNVDGIRIQSTNSGNIDFMTTAAGTSNPRNWRIAPQWTVDGNFEILSSSGPGSDVLPSLTRLAIDVSGNVGIGTTSPVQKLQIANGNILLPDANSSTSGNLFFGGNTSTSRTGMRFFGGLINNGAVEGGFIDTVSTSATGGLIIRVDSTSGGTERMRINTSGNVGIGTQNPTRILHTHSGANANFLKLTNTNSGTADTDGFEFIQGTALEGYVWNRENADLRFGTNNTDQMIILAGGNVGIGTTAPARKLTVLGDARVGTGTTGCVEDADGTVIAGTCSSDERYKNVVGTMTPILSTFTKLEPEYYYWKFAEYPEQSWGNNMQLGLVAQQVEQHIPDLVFTDENGYKKVKYEQLPMYLLRAIKDLYDEVLELKQRVAILEGGGGQ